MVETLTNQRQQLSIRLERGKSHWRDYRQALKTPLGIIEASGFQAFREHVSLTLGQAVLEEADRHTRDLILEALTASQHPYNRKFSRIIAEGERFGRAINYAQVRGGSNLDYIYLSTKKRPFLFGANQEIHFVVDLRQPELLDPKLKILVPTSALKTSFNTL
jgi:hypothetical protein